MTQENLYKITSNNIEKQIEGLDSAIAELDTFYDVCLNALESSPDGIFIAERIQMIKNNLEMKLLALFEKTENPDLRFNIATIVYEDLPRYDHIKRYLLEFIETHQWPAINAPLWILRQRKVKEIVPMTIEMLETVDVHDIDKANFLLDTLKSLDFELSENLRNKFSAPEVPWQVRLSVSKT